MKETAANDTATEEPAATAATARVKNKGGITRPSAAVSAKVARRQPDGSEERCTVYDKSSGVHADHFRADVITGPAVLAEWGSGLYVVTWLGEDGKPLGRPRSVSLEDPDHPQKSARAGAPTRAEAPPPPPAAPPSVAGLPPEVAGLSGAAMFGLIMWAEDRASTKHQQEIERMALRHRQDLDAEAQRHRMTLEIQRDAFKQAAEIRREATGESPLLAKLAERIDALQTRVEDRDEDEDDDDDDEEAGLLAQAEKYMPIAGAILGALQERGLLGAPKPPDPPPSQG